MPVRAASPTRGSLIAVIAVIGATLVACSNNQAAVNKRPHTGAGTATVVNGMQQVTITTGNDYRFHPSTITVHEGRVRIVLQNRAPTAAGPPHDLQVTGLPVAYVPLAVAGQTRSVTFTAPAPGRYGFVCTIHKAQGQTGTLIVEPGGAQGD